MKIVALEEHIVTEAIARATADPAISARPELAARLDDISERRLADMDEDGIDVQVLSLTTPGVQSLGADEAVPLAREANDVIAAAIAAHPDRFAGFATLPTPEPGAVAGELRRCVDELGFAGALLNGRTGDRNIDDPAFADLWAAAADLRVPVYLHPTSPPAAVSRAYYSGFTEKFDFAFANPGLGWHYETGVQLLRLIFSGTFDRHPDLQVIVGHWGEVVLFFAERIAMLDQAGSLERSLIDYLRDNVYYTPSGINSHTYLRWTIEMVGIERILFSADYPWIWSGKGASRRFLEEAELSQTDKDLIACGNWGRLTAAASSPD